MMTNRDNNTDYFRLPLLGLAFILAGPLQLANAADNDAQVLSRPSYVTPGDLSSYKLGSGDVISISVFGEEDLSIEKLRLSDAGTVPYPVLGELKVLNMTVGNLEKQITDGLKGRYLVNPRVSVQLLEYRPFYINGMVEKPGAYPYLPGLTVRKAASLAGGFKERASFDKIYVIRDNDQTQKPAKLDLGAQVYPGDTIVVEDSFF